MKCCGGHDWGFQYPTDRLLPLEGAITDNLMRNPDMWDPSNNELCLLVVKGGNSTSTGTTIGRANGRLLHCSRILHQHVHQPDLQGMRNT